jgi:hypothetical protein
MEWIMSRAKGTVQNPRAGQLLKPKAMRQTIARVEAYLAAEFKERIRSREQVVRQMKKYHAPSGDLLAKRKQAASIIEAIRRLHANRSSLTVGRPQGIARRGPRAAAPPSQRIARPTARPVVPNWLNPWSGGTAVPPYDQASTGWSVGPFGSPGGATLQKNLETVNPSSGAMSIDIESGYKYGYQGVSASGNATLGATIYPYSVFADAFLRASCSPSLNYNWGYWLEDPTPPGSTVYDGGVESSGRIRLLIVEMTQGQIFGNIVADQEAIVWNSGYFGSYPGSVQWKAGSLTSLEVSTPLVPFSPGKFYVILVIGEVDIVALAADPEEENTSAIAWGILNVSVPFIRWELVPNFPVIGTTQTTSTQALRSKKRRS